MGHMQIDIKVHGSIDSVRDDWQRLQGAGVTTLYQTLEWCEAWLATFGETKRPELAIVSGHDNSGTVKFILPLVLSDHGSTRVVEWLAADFATYGWGLFEPDLAASGGEQFAALWPKIVEALPSSDAIWLKHLPARWKGNAHPLSGMFTTPSPNKTYQITLERDYETLYKAKRSSSSRRHAGKRDRRLLEGRDVRLAPPSDVDEGIRLIDEMLVQHKQRLAREGIHNVLDGETADFLKRLADLEDGCPVTMLPLYLTVDERLVAAKIGFVFDGIYWAIVSSLDAGELHRYSPGDFALRRTIKACCERGLTMFDFATGDSDYKQHWADGSIELHELIQPLTARGTLWSAAKRASIDAKRALKNSAYLWPKLVQLRRATLGEKSS